jgi:drug/metabolite transporter (DMT)-like permease
MDLDFKSASNNKYLMMRNMIMLVNQISYGAMHYVVSMPVINILNISGSIFVFVLDYFIHGVQVNKKQLIGMVLGFLGVILTVNGDYLVDLFDPEYSR